jgi:CDP-diacylglycerol--glycerol-3-phosphate 3-phosphatidyltransferase
MNLPNALTLLRIFFVPMLIAALLGGFTVTGLHIPSEFLALGIFLAAGATDLLDGYLARKWKQTTTVGTLLDPIADKLLISAALIALVQVQVVPAWMTVLIIGREFAISGLRSIAAAEGYVIKASDLGKTKLITQVVAISLLLLSIHWPELHGLAIGCMWAVVFFAILSAMLYFRKFWGKIDEQIKTRRRLELLEMERQKLIKLREENPLRQA